MPARVQHSAPDFSSIAVENGLFKATSLSDFAGKWLVLFFYPMDFTFVCPSKAIPVKSKIHSNSARAAFSAEILAFDKAIPDFAAINTAVLACSTDSEYSHLAWANLPRSEGGLGPDLKLPLLADRSHKIAEDYGVLLEEGIALRGLFIIDPTGRLRQMTVNDLPVGRSVDETIRLIKAFQYVEEYGEGCPANWTEGASTIKLDPKGKLEWFNKHEENGAVVTNGKSHTNGNAQTNGKRSAPEDVEINGHTEKKRVKA